jgi:serine/threonine protein kinase
MAPEQERAEEVGKPADVYSLGIVLSEMALGLWSEPETHVSEGSTLRRLSALTRLPPTLRTLIGRCTDVDPRKRPADARVLAEEFATLVGSGGRVGS